MLDELRRILFIAVVGVGVYVGPTEVMGAAHAPAPVLDFNGITAGEVPFCFHPHNYTPPAIGHIPVANLRNGVNYVYFHIEQVLPGIPAAPPLQVDGRVPARGEHNIYFPRNGVQPTTPEAVAWSCANIDNREGSPITGWYMKMFGVIPINHVAIAAAAGGAAPAPIYVRAGWSVSGGAINAQRIIDFHASINNANMISDPDYGDIISARRLFERNFRKIASTSVGRVLLYRILIEIRRHIANNVGTTGNDTSAPVTPHKLYDRNKCRILRIRLSDDFMFDEAGYISICNFPVIDTAIGKEEDLVTHIVKQRIPLDVVLFHEMNHWYHFLRDIVRFDIEYNEHRHHFNSVHQSAKIVQYYWNGVVGDRDRARATVSGKNWEADGRHRIDFEEIRNILGVPSDAVAIEGTINGDDLSENLYRRCVGTPLRFGYSDRSYYEDNIVINRVVKSCLSHREYDNYVTKALGKVNFLYGNNGNKVGLGQCRIFL